MLYADDTQIFIHCLPSELPTYIDLIQQDATAVAQWAEENGLELNTLKTQAIIYGSELYTSQIDLNTIPLISVNTTTIPYSESVKNLGIIFTPTLNWNLQVKQVLRKVQASLASLKFHLKSLPFMLLKQLVQSLVLPLLDYASVVYMSLTSEQSTSLQTAYNSCIRFIHGNIPFLPS